MRSLSGPPQGSREPVRESERGGPAKGLSKTRLVREGGAPVPDGVGAATDGYGRRREGEGLWCPACRADTRRGEWVTVLRYVSATDAVGLPIAVIRHRRCSNLGYARTGS
jgi:hypothetical protein